MNARRAAKRRFGLAREQHFVAGGTNADRTHNACSTLAAIRAPSQRSAMRMDVAFGEIA